MILIDSPLPELQLSLRVVLPIVLAFSAIVRVPGQAGRRRPAAPPVTGVAGMLGEVGQALTAIEPGVRPAACATHGEIWRRRREDRDRRRAIACGSRGVDGLTLTVRKE